MRTIRRHTLVLTAGLAMTCATAPAAAQAVDVAREAEPVILSGADLPAWSGPAATVVCQPYPSGALTGARDAHNGVTVAPPATGAAVDQIAAYRWDGTQYVEIPVQVDQRYFYCLSNPASGFAFYSGTDKELTYAWDVESWKKIAGTCSGELPAGVGTAPDPVPTLDDDDEIAFMASDAGPLAPAGTPPPSGATATQAVAVLDPLNPASVRYVYLVRRPGGSSFDAASGYVSYVRDPDADQWIDRYSFTATDPEKLGSSNTSYGPNLQGTVCDPDGTVRDSTDRFLRDGLTVQSASYRWRASGRWMVRELQVAKPGQPGVYGPDLIDRWKGRAFQQSPDSTISLVGFEDEQVNWEANSALLGERTGPVRAIREVWGADSGTNVTKTETFYRDAITYRYHVRVHPIPPDGLYTSWDYNAHVVAKYYNVLNPDGADIDGVNDDAGNVDGVGTFPAFFDVPDPTFSPPTAILQWEEVSGAGDFGSLVYVIELKGATTVVNPAVVPYYRDDACLDDGTGDDPVQRPWPGEASTDSRVRGGYCAAAGGHDPCLPGEYEALTCEQREGSWGAHGVHYFFSQDSDNAASPEVLTEIDAQQWQFTVPTSAPTNVGARYGNVVVAPLQTVAIATGGLPGLAPPVAGNVTATTDEGTPVTVTLSGLDLDSCELGFTIVDPPAGGTLGAIVDDACAAGTPNTDTARVTYTPDAAFSGSDSFTYDVHDGTFSSNTATVTITVRPEPTVSPTPTPTVTVTPPPGATATPAATPAPSCGVGLCGDTPASGCAVAREPAKGLLLLKDRPGDKGDRLVWKWLKGAATSKGDLGSPLTTTDYEVCLYDAAGTLIGRACAPAGGTCEGKPCWRERRHGYKYRKRDFSPSGTKNTLQLDLKAGFDGKAAIIVKGKGGNPVIPALPLAQPVAAEIVNGGGACWQATFRAPAQQNEPDRFKDRGD
jgi:Bacterial Ig domain